MPFCSQCGKPLETGATCADCGKVAASDALTAITTELRRQRSEMRYMAIAVGLVAAVILGLVAGWMLHGQKKESASPQSSLVQQTPTPVPRSATPANANAAGEIAASPDPDTQPKPATAPSRKGSNSQAAAPADGIDVQAIQNAVGGMSQRGGQRNSSSQHATAGSAQSAADRYPGSEPVDVKDAALPDVGIPVSNQVYSTSDSLSKVMDYYKQLYPDAQVMEISGQTIIAVDRPGDTKVIALGTSGSETRIAIVQPGSGQ